ncbi:MAG: hypothetical protein ACYCOU_10765 [Sulfobacillus sp.]
MSKCPPGYVLNPDSGRCLKIGGRRARELGLKPAVPFPGPWAEDQGEVTLPKELECTGLPATDCLLMPGCIWRRVRTGGFGCKKIYGKTALESYRKSFPNDVRR